MAKKCLKQLRRGFTFPCRIPLNLGLLGCPSLLRSLSLWPDNLPQWMKAYISFTIQMLFYFIIFTFQNFLIWIWENRKSILTCPCFSVRTFKTKQNKKKVACKLVFTFVKFPLPTGRVSIPKIIALQILGMALTFTVNLSCGILCRSLMNFNI